MISNLSIGAGGYITGIAPAADNGNTVYLRTDNSGVYKSKETSWKQLMDNSAYNEKENFIVQSIAVDPNDENTVYTVHSDYDALSEGYILKSTDGGEQWEKLNFSALFPKTLNEGEIIAVDPIDSNNIYVNTDSEMYKSSDKGESWNGIFEFPSSCCAIAIGKSNDIYTASSQDGIYASFNSGVDWSLMSSSPKNVRRMCINDNGEIFAASADGIYKYSEYTWKQVLKSKYYGFNGVDFSRCDNDFMLCVSGPTNDGTGGLYNNVIYYSQDGGENWQILNSHFTAPTSYAQTGLNYASDIKFKNENTAYITDWFGVYRTDNINTTDTLWYRDTKNIENTLAYCVLAGKNNKAYAGLADVGFYKWDDTSKYPSSIENIFVHHATDINYSENNADIMAMGAFITNENKQFENVCLYSLDGGNSWEKAGSIPGLNNITDVSATSHVAVSSGVNDDNNATILYSSSAGNGLYNTSDYGVTWNKCSGIPDSFGAGKHIFGNPVAADKVNPKCFYAVYNGSFYVSVDGGKEFYEYKNKGLPSSVGLNSVICPSSYNEGEVYVCVKGNGIYKSVSYGQTFEKVGNFVSPLGVAVGKGKDLDTQTIYVYESDIENQGFYKSNDNGQTFEKITNERNALSTFTSMSADTQNYGIVYVGTNGRGVFKLKFKN